MQALLRLRAEGGRGRQFLRNDNQADWCGYKECRHQSSNILPAAETIPEIRLYRSLRIPTSQPAGSGPMAAFSVLAVIFACLMCHAICANHPGFDVAIQTHNAPGTSDADTRLAVRENLISLRKLQGQDETYKTNVTLQRSWEDATLLLSVPCCRSCMSRNICSHFVQSCQRKREYY